MTADFRVPNSNTNNREMQNDELNKWGGSAKNSNVKVENELVNDVSLG